MIHATILLACVLGNGASNGFTQNNLSYEEALSQAEAKNKPLLVVVGAPWCPACVHMKQETISQMQRNGDLDDVVVTLVDCDQRPKLAGKLMEGSAIPQVILYTKRNGKWRRFSLVGAQSVTRMRKLLSDARSESTQVLR